MAEQTGTDTAVPEGAIFEEFASSSEAEAGDASRAARGMEAMMNVRMDVQVVLGHARMPISDLLRLGRGSVVQLDRQIGEPVDVVVNDMLVARGNLVKLDGDRIGVTLTELMRGQLPDA
ncbi:flagellar motor switch protein FliN [Roseicyclus sp.]|uniref:flagellar motor switch protein FliN n=1 Tax=Roseicyclus sp. TaxID=1914329 RepID=UPI003F9F6E6A